MWYSLIFSIVFLIIFPSIAVPPSPDQRTDQGGIDTPPSPNCHLVHTPEKVHLGPPFLPPNFVIFDPLGKLNLFAKKTSPSLAAGFREYPKD